MRTGATQGRRGTLSRSDMGQPLSLRMGLRVPTGGAAHSPSLNSIAPLLRFLQAQRLPPQQRNRRIIHRRPM